MEKEIFEEAIKDIKISIARFAIDFANWLSSLGTIEEMIAFMPSHMATIGDGVLADARKSFTDIQAFLILMALYRGYLYGEYFLNQEKYKSGGEFSPSSFDATKIMDEIIPKGSNNLPDDYNIAEHVDLFFHALISESVHVYSDDLSEHNTPDVANKSQQQMMLGLLARFAEIRLADRDKKNNIIDHLNEIVILNPNIAGVGINFNKLLQFLRK